MHKGFLETAQDVVSAIRKAVRRLEGQPALASKVKLNGRRGYGDREIPSPDQRWTSTNPERRPPLRDEHEKQERRKDHEMDEAVENVGPPGTEGEKARDS